MSRSRWRRVIKPAYSVSFLLSINIFVWQNVLYFLDALRTLHVSTLSCVTLSCVKLSCVTLSCVTLRYGTVNSFWIYLTWNEIKLSYALEMTMCFMMNGLWPFQESVQDPEETGKAQSGSQLRYHHSLCSNIKPIKLLAPTEEKFHSIPVRPAHSGFTCHT